ncbi:hypothetical protein DESUT3_22380 [Desulfuromonas versatilis]|uniref:DUF523 domain-containing protein n=1 Tax=Desulfuromonas versatilis TaxID=2802975 RepID=A0ABN6E037_9BACT|nr:DUF523 domain-containing protein [Desulfuromonas versatilis]BCR05169.1 hypothetical protein DESUT3_22380 [Desulfuromonas versatilis]
MPRPILVSACLLGLSTRYDGSSKKDERVEQFIRENDLLPIPVCPEQLAGLPTPRPAARFISGDGCAVLDGTGRLVDANGDELNQVFLRGAVETMKIARLTGATQALLKQRSPSCGTRQVYRDETLVPGQGVTSALLSRNRIEVFSEEDPEGLELNR